MRQVTLLLLVLVFVVAGLAPKAVAQEEKKEEKKVAAAKHARWHGIVVMTNKDKSTLTVRRKRVDKVIHFDSSTKWTKGAETIEPSQVKDGADVICLGTYDEKSEFHATRIDVRENP